jgi:SAM-dependent methyltransferase
MCSWQGDNCLVEPRFRTAAAYYARFRPAYPPELIERLAQATQLDGTTRVLDLGCRPGTLAIPIAAFAGEVVAVDVEPAMIAELRRTAPTNVTAVAARAEEVDGGWGQFGLVTAGRAFHWFDAELVLARLVAISPALALVGDDLRDSNAQSRALTIAVEVMGESPIQQPREGRRHLDRYTKLLRSSAFSAVEIISIETERTWTPDELIGLCYSTALASPERLGQRMSAFEQRVREELAPIQREQVTVDAVIGRQHAVGTL